MKRKSNCLATILFLIYLALLVWIILFKLQFSISDLDKVRSINLIPFHYDKEVGAAFHLTEVLENFLIFVPMGIYLQMLLPRTKLYVKFMLIAGTSFLLETMQYILAVGRSDITDERRVEHLLRVLPERVTARFPLGVRVHNEAVHEGENIGIRLHVL